MVFQGDTGMGAGGAAWGVWGRAVVSPMQAESETHSNDASEAPAL